MSSDLGYKDTPISGVSSLTFPRALVNFGADFNIVEDEAHEVKLTNVTSPLDRPENFRFAYSAIKNIYNGTDIQSEVQAPLKRGVSLLTQNTNILSVSDAHGNVTYLPVSAHMVLKFPANQAITARVVENQVARLVSSLYETGLLSHSRLESMMRGSLLPKDI